MYVRVALVMWIAIGTLAVAQEPPSHGGHPDRTILMLDADDGKPVSGATIWTADCLTPSLAGTPSDALRRCGWPGIRLAFSATLLRGQPMVSQGQPDEPDHPKWSETERCLRQFWKKQSSDAGGRTTLGPDVVFVCAETGSRWGWRKVAEPPLPTFPSDVHPSTLSALVPHGAFRPILLRKTRTVRARVIGHEGSPVAGMMVALDARITRAGELPDDLQWNARTDEDGFVRFCRVPLPVAPQDAMELTIAIRIVGSKAKPLPLDPTNASEDIVELKAPPFGALEVRFRGTAPTRRDLPLPLPVVPVVWVEPTETSRQTIDRYRGMESLPSNEHPDVVAYGGSARFLVAVGTPLSVTAVDCSTESRSIHVQHEGIRSPAQLASLTLDYDDLLPHAPAPYTK